jgi:hypothetical protein
MRFEIVRERSIDEDFKDLLDGLDLIQITKMKWEGREYSTELGCPRCLSGRLTFGALVIVKQYFECTVDFARPI